MDRAAFDVGLPGLPLVLAASPCEAARQLVEAFRGVASLDGKVGWVYRGVVAQAGPVAGREGQALLAAGVAIAGLIDGEAGFFDRHAYHNRQHFCEVMLTAHLLGRWHGLPAHETRLMLLAALIHDIEHDGGPGADFAYERRSVARAMPLLRAAGIGDESMDALAALVLATEPRRGVPAALAAHRSHFEDAPWRPPADAPELAALARCPALALAARLLCEADILPSVGLTPEHGLCLQDRLSTEWCRPLGLEDKLRFIDDVLASGVIGAYFLPNVQAMRQAIRGWLDAAGR